MPVRTDLLEILVCPKCKGTLDPIPEPDGLGCKECKLVFKIEDEIPNFLIEEAVPLG